MSSNQGMGGGGHGNMGGASLQDMQRLQQQLQYGRSPSMGMGGSGGGMTPQFQNMNPSQFAALQQAQQTRNQPGMGNTALAMMQQANQSGQGNPLGMSSSSNYGNWNNMGGQGGATNSTGSTMDASTGSSARLMAMAGMGLPNSNSGANLKNTSANMMDSSSTMQNMQALMQHQQKSAGRGSNFPQQGQLGSNSLRGRSSMVGGDGSKTNSQLMMQRQLANLQQQRSGSSSGGVGNSTVGMQGMGNMPSAQGASQASLLAHQQQLIQQIQKHKNGGSSGSGMMQQMPSTDVMGMMQSQIPGMAQQRGSMTGSNFNPMMGNQSSGQTMANGSLSEHRLRLHQQSLLRGTQPQQSDMTEPRQMNSSQSPHLQTNSMNSMQQMNSSSSSQQHGRQMYGSGMSGMNMMNQQGDNYGQQQGSTGGMDSSVRSHHSTSSQSPGAIDLAPSEQKTFLDGDFTGGWQSNADLPDRRKVIFRILDVIRQMRPDTAKMSDKLPHMAKSLEEHLYRSAPTKQDYLNSSTLKDRLQAIAHGLELHRSTSGSGSSASRMKRTDSNFSNSAMQQPGVNQTGFNSNLQGHRNSSYHEELGSGGGKGGSSSNQMGMQQNDNWSSSQSNSGNFQMGGNMSSQSGMQSGMNNYSQGMSQSVSSNIGQQGMMGVNNLNQQSGMTHNGSVNSMGGQTGGMALHGSNTNLASNQAMHPGSGMSNFVGGQQQNASWSNTSGSNNLMGNSMSTGSTNGNMMNNPMSLMQRGMQGQPNMPQMDNPMFQANQGNVNSLAAAQLSASQTSFTSATSSQAPMGRQQNAAWNSAGSSMAPPSNMTSTAGGMGMMNPNFSNQPSMQDPGAAQKKKVILQQQQRLLLLRHASKCTAGGSCTTKFCPQMVTLWRHMKTCRDRNCKTSHCLSSRCVLNHYRICKSNGKTATCEVCGPVMLKIKDLDRGGSSQVDPLTKDADANKAQSASKYAMMNRMGTPTDQAQLRQLQAQQLKLKQQLENLKQLQKQQEKLLEQQKSLEEEARHIKDPNTPQAHQLREQQLLLQQLQKRCQQQQLLLEQEIQIQSSKSMGRNTQVPMQSKPDIAQLASVNQSVPAMAMQSKRRPSANQVRVRQTGKKRIRNTKTLQSAAQAIPQATLSQLEKPRKRASSITSSSAPNSKRIKGLDQSLQVQSLDVPVQPVLPPVPAHATSANTASTSSTGDSSVSDGTSLISFMTKEDIEAHLESLNKRTVLSPRTVTHKCMPILQALIDHQFSWVFHDAVDPVALGLPDYFDVIKHPMHLELVKKKLENAVYPSMEVFSRDVRLVFENAILYNGDTSEVGELAQKLLDVFEVSYNGVLQAIESSQQNLESQGHACSLCGTQKRLFEPTVLYCQGVCGMQQIKRHATYYTDHTKQNHWCESCFALLDSDEPIVLDDGCEVKKGDLQEYKNDALPEEAWVQCDDCKSWVHQICTLFNGRTNKTNVRYTCPTCYLRKTSSGSAKPSEEFVKAASDLPKSKMSDEIEKGLQEALQSAYRARATELGVQFEDVEKVQGLTIRVVSNVEKKQVVGDEMFKRYSSSGCEREYPVRTKCIALFQKIHGVETLLFAMYVYEYGHGCAAPNRRRVYISYLDSVKYFEPKCYRTTVYHSILVEYLRYVKERGFHTAHIWSCPPTPGDDYIFYCHPEQQMVPREDMLRAWYHKMLDHAKTQGIVIRTSTLYDEYFAANGLESVEMRKSDPTCLPYFEGDYIPGEIENIIKLEKQQGGDGSSGDSVMARLGQSLSKMKDNFIVVHLRSRRFAAAVERGDDVSSWREDSDDEVVRSKRAKISGKDSSVLYPKESMAKTESVVAPVSSSTETRVEVAAGVSAETTQPSQASALAQGQDAVSKSEAAEVAITTQPTPVATSALETTADSSKPATATTGGGSGDSADPKESTSMEKSVDGPTESSDMGRSDVEKAEASSGDKVDDEPLDLGEPLALDDIDAPSRDAKPSGGFGSPFADGLHDDDDPLPFDADVGMGNFHDPEDDHKETTKVVATDVASSAKVSEVASSTDKPKEKAEPAEKPVTSSVSTDAVKVEDVSTTSQAAVADTVPSESQKRGLEEIEPALSRHFGEMNRSVKTVRDTADDDEPMQSEMFESRQRFLNYCQANHCQFDDLRRAKHSTMMVLFQLHNPLAPKFLQSCGACYRDITHGMRYHCQSCSNFDLCQECYEPVTSGRLAQRDPRFAHDSSHKFTPIDMEAPEEPDKKSREEQEKSLKGHIALLEHAASCQGSTSCSLQNCQRMKRLIAHVGSCDVKPKKDCKICSRVLSLCSVHSRVCTVVGGCPIPFCDRIKERNKRLRKQQQLMDDRRRQAQNELYHAGPVA